MLCCKASQQYSTSLIKVNTFTKVYGHVNILYLSSVNLSSLNRHNHSHLHVGSKRNNFPSIQVHSPVSQRTNQLTQVALLLSWRSLGQLNTPTLNLPHLLKYNLHRVPAIYNEPCSFATCAKLRYCKIKRFATSLLSQTAPAKWWHGNLYRLSSLNSRYHATTGMPTPTHPGPRRRRQAVEQATKGVCGKDLSPRAGLCPWSTEPTHQSESTIASRARNDWWCLKTGSDVERAYKFGWSNTPDLDKRQL